MKKENRASAYTNILGAFKNWICETTYCTRYFLSVLYLKQQKRKLLTY